MTDYVMMPAAHYQNICDAVREKTGKTDPLCSGQVPGEIRSISQDGNGAFWDAYQQNGERVNYYQRFVQDGWNDETFRPKYPITCRNGSTNARSVFYNSRMTRIPVPVIITGIPAKETFNQCSKLVTIDRLVLEGVTDCTGMFLGCVMLRDLHVEGSIGVDFSLSAAGNLSNESAERVIGCLQDLTGLTTQTLTLHNAVGNGLTDTQKAAITAKNWTLAY